MHEEFVDIELNCMCIVQLTHNGGEHKMNVQYIYIYIYIYIYMHTFIYFYFFFNA